MTPFEFLTARYDEDEAAARAADEVAPAPWDWSDRGHSAALKADAPNFPTVVNVDQTERPGDAWITEHADLRHLERWQPARVLNHIAANRAILNRTQAWITADTGEPHQKMLRLAAEDIQADLAAPFVAHPDYDPAWRPAWWRPVRVERPWPVSGRPGLPLQGPD